MSVQIDTGPDLRIRDPVPLFNHLRYLFMQGQYYTARGRFVFATNPNEHVRLADQIVYVRDWRLMLDTASPAP